MSSLSVKIDVFSTIIMTSALASTSDRLTAGGYSSPDVPAAAADHTDNIFQVSHAADWDPATPGMVATKTNESLMDQGVTSHNRDFRLRVPAIIVIKAGRILSVVFLAF